jgi:hypothetical protein
MSKIVVGKTEFRDSYADANVRFVVRKDMGNGLYLCISDDVDYSGIERYFSAEQIRNKVDWVKRIERSFTARDDFWANQKVGAVLHYHNGHGNYVRGKVIEVNGEKKLRPLAMVGLWKPMDLPQRRPNGEIYYPYNPNKIVNATDEDAAWQPSESCVFESPTFCPPGTMFDPGDPRKLEPIDLTVPDMTPAEQSEALMEQTLDRVRALIEDRYRTSAPIREVLRDISLEVQGF